MPNLRYTARGRPHIWHRRLWRVENFGSRLAIAILDLLATSILAFNPVGGYFFFLPLVSSVWNGIPICVSISRDSSSLAFLITNVMFIP